MSDLMTAFANTTFFTRVYTGSQQVPSRVHQKSPALDDALRRCGIDRWTQLTAYNPLGQQVSQAANTEAHQRLIDVLSRKSIQWWPGYGLPDDPSWGAEVSVVLLGVRLHTAMQLAQDYGQAAIVHGLVGGRARLLAVPPPPVPA